MKNFKVKSPIYRGTSVNFEGFILNFDSEGIAEVKNLEGGNIENFENILKIYPNIYDVENPPKDLNKEEKTKDTTVVTNSSSTVEFNILKESNIKLALENKKLKEENSKLKEEIEFYKKNLEENNKDKEDSKTENNEDKENIEKELNAKSIVELKEVLNDVYKDYKDEWKTLTKKDDIIKYIIDKSLEK